MFALVSWMPTQWQTWNILVIRESIELLSPSQEPYVLICNIIIVLSVSPQINHFHSKNIRVILWATSMVDNDSPNFQEAYDNGYLIKYELIEWLYMLFILNYCRDFYDKQAIISWWHGNGGLIDYTNEHAIEWWHKQMNNVTRIDSMYAWSNRSLFFLGTLSWYWWLEVWWYWSLHPWAHSR